MTKPPPDREQIIQALETIYNKPGAIHTEQSVIRDAIEALNTPQSAEQLVDALERQSHVIEAAGWQGVAINMRDAARRLNWQLRHGGELPGIKWPMSDEDVIKELYRFARRNHTESGYWENLAANIANRLQQRQDKPAPDALTEFNDLEIGDLLRTGAARASHAQIAFVGNENKPAIRKRVEDSIAHLQAALRKLA